MMTGVTAFAACGEKPAETTAPSAESKAPAETDPRLAIKDNVPENLKFNGETVTFFSREDQDIYKFEIACEELLNNTLFDAIHYRNIDVENRLGVKISNLRQFMYGSSATITAWNQNLSTSVLTNTGDYDGAMIYTSQTSPLAKEGIFYNLLMLSPEYGGDGYFDFTKPWWNQSLVDELSVYGTLFFAGGDVTVTEITDLFGIVFNKDMFEEKFPEERVDGLYQTVSADVVVDPPVLDNYDSGLKRDQKFLRDQKPGVIVRSSDHPHDLPWIVHEAVVVSSHRQMEVEALCG